MYGDVVLGRRPTACSRTRSRAARTRADVTLDTELRRKTGSRSGRRLQGGGQREHRQARSRKDAREQLWGAIGAVFDCWDNHRANVYRRLYDIPDSWGTASTCRRWCSATWATQRHRRRLHARSVDRRARLLRRVPAQRAGRGRGRRHPHAAAAHRGRAQRRRRQAVARGGDAAATAAGAGLRTLEKHYRDMQDIEFTIQRRQALDAADPQRQAHRAAARAHRRRDGGGGPDRPRRGGAARRSGGARPAPAPHARSRPPSAAPRRAACRRSPGAAIGRDRLHRRRGRGAQRHGGERVILVRRETSPEDIHGMNAARGILTARGGMTSHAAVVARGMGKPLRGRLPARSRIDATAGTS